jgi:hypothetical protein
MATSWKDFVGDVVSELVGEVFSIGALKKIIAKSAAEKASGGTEAKAAAATGAKSAGEDKTPRVSFGGAFDYSDEEAYFGLIGRMNSDPSLAGAAQKVSRFLIAKDRFSYAQRRKFRAVVGNLARVEFTKQVDKTRTETPRASGDPVVTEKSTEVKSNLGLEFIKSLSALDENDMLEVCKAAGIMDSPLDELAEGVKHVTDKVGELAKATQDAVKRAEKKPAVQKTMTTMANKMKARINNIENNGRRS